MPNPNYTVLALISATFITPGAIAQPAEPDPQQVQTTPDAIAPPNPYRPRITFRVQSSTVLPSDVGSTPGDLTTQRLGTGVEVGIPLSQATRISLSARHESSFYNFDGTTGLTPFDDDPVSHLAETGLGFRIESRINEEMTLLAGADVTSSGELGADFGDTLTVGAFGGAMFDLNEKLSLGGGLIVSTRLEDNSIFVPFPLFEYRASERLTIGTRDRGVGLRYVANEWVTLRGRLDFETHEYRLDGGAGRLNNGTFQDNALTIGAGIDFKPEQRVTVSLDAGLLAYREIEFKDSTGSQINQHDAAPGVSIGLTVNAQF